jgi:hypothetical protein
MLIFIVFGLFCPELCQKTGEKCHSSCDILLLLQVFCHFFEQLRHAAGQVAAGEL